MNGTRYFKGIVLDRQFRLDNLANANANAQSGNNTDAGTDMAAFSG